MAHRIEVTSEDIARGVPFNASNCPIAHAARRCLGVDFLLVGTRVIYIDNLGYVMPDEARQWAKDFDFGKQVEPISFEVQS